MNPGQTNSTQMTPSDQMKYTDNSKMNWSIIIGWIIILTFFIIIFIASFVLVYIYSVEENNFKLWGIIGMVIGIIGIIIMLSLAIVCCYYYGKNISF